MTDKKAISLSGENISDVQILERLAKIDPEQKIHAQGIGGDPLYEPVPQFIKTHSENILENGHNAWIVLGRDRPSNRLSGYGGRGDTQAASIDIVAGRMGYKAKAFSEQQKRIWVDPDFENDAARIYISQKTDVDENFKLAAGRIGNIKTRSAIAIKADEVRFVARGGIKLITGTDKKNSQGGNGESFSGIDIIANNDDSDLQPMVKGNNLKEALRRIVFHMDKLNGIVDSLLMAQMLFNTALTHHFHFSPFFGLPPTPSPIVVAAGVKTMIDHLTQTKMSLISHKVNLGMFKMSYLHPAGSNYISSRWNNLN